MPGATWRKTHMVLGHETFNVRDDLNEGAISSKRFGLEACLLIPMFNLISNVVLLRGRLLAGLLVAPTLALFRRSRRRRWMTNP